MTEVTAVPIPPTKRSWLFWLWAGVAVALIAGIGLAWSGTAKPVAAASACLPKDFPAKGPVTRLASGVAVQTIKPGSGNKPAAEDFVLIGYKGTLRDGTVFDQQPRAPFQLTQVVPGFSEGLRTMQPGGTYRLCIPPALGYGEHGAGPIPANSTLFFDIDFLESKTLREVQQMQAQMQQMQQMMRGQQQGQPEGPEAPAQR